MMKVETPMADMEDTQIMKNDPDHMQIPCILYVSVKTVAATWLFLRSCMFKRNSSLFYSGNSLELL